MEMASNFYFLFRWHLPGFVGHYTAFFLGLFFMLVYYIFFHPTGGAHIDFNRFLLTTSKRRRKVNKESTESGTPKDFAAKPAEASMVVPISRTPGIFSITSDTAMMTMATFTVRARIAMRVRWLRSATGSPSVCKCASQPAASPLMIE